ncbi:zinc finger and SCAN domain-containing protein 29-like [Siphateles boraxobius]|uniref:zinc finger and SCAN domain-containing protein 29-like n=1 Tax=Siphateles boraxobius TaxID=180520 RepID=UPI004063D201
MAESWSVDEVQTFLSLVAEERIQRELDGAKRNEKVFQEVAQLLSAHGYYRTYKQCRDKLKKLKSDYRTIKDHNGRSGANRRTWKWFDQMDAIYGRRPASNGREGALDSATSLLDNTFDDDALSTIDSLALSPCSDASTSQMVIAASPPARPPTPATSSTSRTPERVVPGKRKRSMHHQEHLAVLREMQVADIQQQELNWAQRELHLQMADGSQ